MAKRNKALQSDVFKHWPTKRPMLKNAVECGVMHNQGSSMEPRISMITLGVEDLDKSIEFYETGLGLPKMDSPPGTAFFTLNGSWLGLYPRDLLAKDASTPSAGSGFSGFTISHNVATEGEVDQIISQALSAGAQLVKKPQKASWGGYSSYFKDFDGHLWEVAHNPFFWVGPESKNA